MTTLSNHSKLPWFYGPPELNSLRGFVAGAPLLVHNTFADEGEAFSQTPPAVHICPSPFGSSNPAIPTARSITLARVASPISINRKYQHLCVDALKAYFGSEKRLMKQGDLLALPIDTDLARCATTTENSHEEEYVGPMCAFHLFPHERC
jgi:peroxin-6